ncbi:MAG TPA: NAD(P)/FAD-dependent oxidoreductase [Nitrospiria bacterium]
MGSVEKREKIKKRVEIVGAGPSGLAAAIGLRQAGFEVTVYEERKDVGHRFHGDFQGIENWSLEQDALEKLHQMGLSINFQCVPFYVGTIYGPNREKAEIRSDRPLFYLVRRGPGKDTLDHGLKEQALGAGVEILFGRRIEKIHGAAITATGPKGADAIARGLNFETDSPDQILGIFDDRLAPGGYAYLLVHQGRATMATVLFRDFHHEKDYFKRTREAFHALTPFGEKNAREFGGFGNFFLREKEEHGHHLYVGESAGFQDFLWGFGMRYAMDSGHLAAQSMIHGLPYDILWRNEFLPRLQASMINRVLVDRWGHLVYAYMVRRLAKIGDVRRFMNRLYKMNPWKRLLIPYAVRHYHSRVKDERCRHSETCDCVWCRCQRE